MTIRHPGFPAGEHFPGFQRVEAELVRLRQLQDQPDIQECLRSELGRIVHALSNAVAFRPAAPLRHSVSKGRPSAAPSSPRR